METPPQKEKATQTYLHFAAYGLPALLLIIFANLVLLPKIEMLWAEAGAAEVKHQWIIQISRGFGDNFNFILGLLTVCFLILEKTSKLWPLLRSRIVRGLTWLMTFCVLLGMTWIAVTASLAGSIAIGKLKRAAQPAEAPAR